MTNIFKNLKNTLFSNKKQRHFIAASNLEKKAIKLNLKSKEYLKLAKRNSEDWKNKWLEIIS
tara:strand:+ start:584 stop:769 length:186 start_codon:yes stop_codon:yes gene_type:complete